MIVQLAVDSLAAASLYALVALAVSLAFSGSGTVHLAIGQVAMAGGLTASALVTAGVPIVFAALGGLAVAAVLSGVAERGLIAPINRVSPRALQNRSAMVRERLR